MLVSGRVVGHLQKKNHLVMAGWMRYSQVLVEREQIMADGRKRARSNKKPGVF